MLSKGEKKDWFQSTWSWISREREREREQNIDLQSKEEERASSVWWAEITKMINNYLEEFKGKEPSNIAAFDRWISDSFESPNKPIYLPVVRACASAWLLPHSKPKAQQVRHHAMHIKHNRNWGLWNVSWWWRRRLRIQQKKEIFQWVTNEQLYDEVNWVW